MAEMGFISTFGDLAPNEYGATSTDPVFTQTETEICSCTVGEHVYTYKHLIEYGDRRVNCYQDGVYIGGMYTKIYTGATYGFYATRSGNTIEVFYIFSGNWEQYVEGQTNIVPNDGSGGYGYSATLFAIATPEDMVQFRDWDETPTEDASDPDNLLPQGGEYADLGEFSTTDNIGISDLPNPDATMNMSFSSFVTCFLLDSTAMQGLGTALFNASFWSNLKSKFEGLSDPLSMILACHQIPLAVTGTAGQFQIGGVVPENNGQPVPVTRTATRYVKLNMGSITLKEMFGSEKDYSNVSIQLYLPYVGMRDVDPDLVIGNTLSLVCYIDIWTGDVLYMLHVSNATRSKKYFTSETVPYRWSGNCAKGVPLGRVDNSRMIMNMVTTVASVGAGLATMGLGSVGAIGGATATATGTETVSKASNVASIKEGAKQVGGAVTEAVSSSKLSPIVQSSGGVAGAVGQMDFQYAYIIVKRGVPKYPNDWRAQFGAPNHQTLPIAGLSGFTQFSTIHLEHMGVAVAEEISELERLITTEGIIL